MRAFFELHRGNKVGGRKPKTIVARHTGERGNATRRGAVFGGVARGLDVDRTHRVGREARIQQAGRRSGDKEPIERGERLVRLRSGNVDLAGTVANHAGNVTERLADIAGDREGNVDDGRIVERTRGGDLLRIDGRRGGSH